MTSKHSGFIVQIRAQIHQISTEFPLDLLSRTGPQNVTRKTRPARMALCFQAVFHCTVASKQARIHINMAENYSRTIHVTTLRHLNFGPVLRIDSNITSTISVPYKCKQASKQSKFGLSTFLRMIQPEYDFTLDIPTILPYISPLAVLNVITSFVFHSCL